MKNLNLFICHASKATRTLLSIFMLLFLFSNTQAQSTKIISGTLSDAQGDPLPGVSILIKGTTEGTITDFNGYYSIEAPIGSYLVYKYVGYIDNEVLVTSDERADEKEIVTGDKKDNSEPEKVYSHTIPDGKGKTLSPYFFVKSDNPKTDRLPLKSTSAEVVIAGVIADVTVTQRYINEGNSTLEAIYIFPGSTKSAVYGMSMQLGNRVLNAVIKEKAQARHDYEKAKEEGKTASLLEQHRPNVFQMNVANILPGDTIDVKIKYTELIEATEGIYSFTYPTVLGPRYSGDGETGEDSNEEWVANPYLQENESPNYTFDLSVRLNSAIPIKKLSSNTHEVTVSYNDANTAVVGLKEEERFGGNRDFILNYGLRGGKVESGILLYEHGDENFFLLMVEPPKTSEIDDIPGREYVFIVDVSGSMHGYPLDVSKAAIEQLLKKLRPTDKFNIMTFAGESKMMWDGSKSATSENIRKGLNFVNLKKGGGGTRLINALDKALSIKADDGYSRSFIVLTDGYVSFEKETFITVRDNLNEANLFVMGIGSSVNHYLIEGLAHAGMGDSYVATNKDEAKKIGQKLMDYIEKPVLTDIRIDYGEFNAYDFEPSSIPDVFAQRPIVVYGKYTGSTEGQIKIKGVTGDVPYVKSFNLSKANTTDNQALRYLWARNKIRYLDDYAQYYIHGREGYATEEATKDEITSLGLNYNLLTKYTSFIAIDDVVRAREEAQTVKQVLPLPKGVSNRAVGNIIRSITSGGSLNLSLTEDLMGLEEVVVVGYGVQRKSHSTGSVSQVKSQSLNNNSESDISQALQGALPGVQLVQNSGSPGAESTIRVRGVAAISGANEPLYIVDGVVYSSANPLKELNLEDVESIEVLKDAVATSIFGAKGSNGVILINTKKAKGTDLKIKSVVGFNQADLSNLDSYTNSHLWYADKLRTSSYQKYDLSLSHSRENLAVLSSGSYMNNKGVVDNTGRERYTVLTNVNAKVFDKKLEFGGMFNGVFSTMENSEPFYAGVNEEPQIYNHEGVSSSLISGVFSELKLPVKGLKLKLAFSGNKSENRINSQDSTLIEYDRDNSTIRYESGLNYQSYIGSHEIKIAARYEYYTEKDKFLIDYMADNEGNLNLNYMERNHAVISHLNYSYKNRYIVHLNYRTEKALEGIDGDTWFHSPTLSLAYTIDQEPFMNSLNFVSQLKFRYSNGLTHRLHVPSYSMLNSDISTKLFNLSEYYPIQSSEDIQTEVIHKQNMGMDLGFLENRLTTSIDLFRNKTTEMFYLNAIGDDSFEWINAGSYSNTGIDVGLNVRIINKRNSSLSANINLAHNKTRLEDVNPENSVGVFRNINGIITGQELRNGDPIGLYYGYKVSSVDPINGEIVLEDVNNDNTIDELDRQAIANTNPKYYGGFGLKYSYKNWDLSTKFNYSYGNQVINMSDVRFYGEYSYAGTIGVNENTLFHDLYVSEGSYLRMSNLSAGYTFRDVRFIGIKDIKLNVSAKNLLTITNYKGQDPEFNNRSLFESKSTAMLRGVDMNLYPVSKSIYLSIEINF